MFPPGLPGIGLLLLRASVAAALLAEQYAYHGTLSTWMLIVAALLFLAISVGYMTPVVAVLGLLSHGLIWYRQAEPDSILMLVVVLDAIALALLGPGAYSLDGYRFGRRMLVLPPS
jgi:hypothetical protein